MSEISERDLRRRFSRQDDPAFAARVSFAKLTAGAAPTRRPIRRVVFAVLALVAILGAGVAIVAVRRPVAPTTPAVSVPSPPPPTTNAARDNSEELALRLVQAEDVRPRALAAHCQPMTAAERAEASVDFGQTSLPLYTCTLTFADVANPVPFRVSVLPNGCFVSHPVDKDANPSVVQACGVTPAPPLTGLAKIAQDVGWGVEITSRGVVSRLTAEIGGESVQLVTYRGQRNLTCFIAVRTKPGAANPEPADEPVCPSVGDARNIDARVVRLRPSRTLVLAGTVAADVTGLRLTRGDQTTVYDVPQTTIPGTDGRHPFLVDITGASQVEGLAGDQGVAQYGLNGKSFPAPADSLHDPLPAGRTFAYLLGMGRQGGSFVLDADPAQFLTGAEAASYCAGLGDADCEIDYSIANPDSSISFGTVPPTAKVVLVDRANCCEQTIEITVAQLAERVNNGKAIGPFWVTAAANGVVSRIEEQYLP